MTMRVFACAVVALMGCDASQELGSSKPESPPVSVADEVVAEILGTSIRRRDLEAESLDRLICAPLFAKYERDNGIAATESEIADCARFFQELSQSPELRAISTEDGDDSSPEMSAEVLRMIRKSAAEMVLQWKMSRHLYEEFGGTVVFQQANPLEPVGAYLAFLQKQESAGAFRILDADLVEPFWADLKKPPQFVVSPEDVDYSTPWWKKGQ